MKFNFKKITSVLASAVMLGSTMGFAAAATYPVPFVQGGAANVGVVVGENAANSDYLAAINLGNALTASLTAQSTDGGSSSSTVTGGDSVRLAKSTDSFNLGDDMNDFYTSLDSDELKTVLADGIYTNDENDDFEYDQKISLGDLQLTHFQDADFNDEKPIIGFDLGDDTFVMNYTLDFSPDSAEGGTAFVSLETTDLTLLGRDYYVVDATSTTNGVKLSLLDSANSAIITSGETSTITVGDDSYDVTIEYISGTNDEVILDVGGVQTNTLNEGDVYKIDSNTYIAVKNNLAGEGDADIDKVEISIGSGKIVLENAQEVKINNDEVSDIAAYNDAVLKAYITNSSTDIDKIVLEWTLGDDTWIAPENELVMPGFETIKLSMAGFTMPGAEVTNLENDGANKARIKTFLDDGAVSFDILYANASGTGFTGIGKDSDDLLVTSSGSEVIFNMSQDEWFVASWVSGDDAESYLLKVTDIDDNDPAKNVTTIESQATDSTVGLTLDIGETDNINSINFLLNTASEDDKVANITVSAVSGGTVSLNKLYTKDGLKIQLPYDSVDSGDGAINLTNDPTSFVMNFTEETEDGDIDAGESFTATWGFNSDEVEVDAVSVTDYAEEDGSDNYIGYVQSDLATMTFYATGDDQDTLDITYAGSESYADVYVSESGAVITALEGTITPVTTVGSVMSVRDSEVSSVQDKNLIVIGGSCINSVAAEILEGDFCSEDFTNATGVGPGQFLIKVVESPYDATKIAMLVAGYEKADTTKAVDYVISDAPITDVGTEKKLVTATYGEVE